MYELSAKNDRLRVDRDGRLTFLGRANRYFINDEGRKYEAGRVETEIARQPGIESCCVVPVYIKTTHDNIPMLCVKTLEGSGEPKDVVLTALKRVFLTEKTLTEEDLPLRVMIVSEMPRNGNGKIDLYRIGRGEVEGETYTLEPKRVKAKVTHLRLVPYEEGPADMIKEVFDGISAEFKNSLPFGKNCSTEYKQEEKEMKSAKKAFDGFNAMNRMGKQMMNNMWGQGKNSGGFGCWGMPGMPNMMGGMPNMQGMPQNMMQSMMPMMQQQMNQTIACMQQMNQMALEMMQKTFEQNCQMMQQFMDAAQKMAGGCEKEACCEQAEAQEDTQAEPQAEAGPAEEEKPAKESKAKKEDK